MECPECGIEIKDDAEFCPECGTEILLWDYFTGILGGVWG